MKRWITVAVAIALGASGLALAQGSPGLLTPDQVIAARQEAYDLMAGLVVGMKAAVDNKLDVKDFKDASEAIANWGRIAPTLFPDGTQQGHNTKAKPNVWSDREGFVKAANNLTDQATRLAQFAAANDKDGFAQQFRATAGACKNCHDTYRAK